MAVRLTNRSRDAMADAFAALLEGDNANGVLRVFAGDKPAGANDGNGSAIQLLEMTFTPTAFNVTTEASATHGELTLAAVLLDETAEETGLASWGLIEDVNGNKLCDFDCPGDLNVATVTANNSYQIRQFTFTLPEEC